VKLGRGTNANAVLDGSAVAICGRARTGKMPATSLPKRSARFPPRLPPQTRWERPPREVDRQRSCGERALFPPVYGPFPSRIPRDTAGQSPILPASSALLGGTAAAWPIAAHAQQSPNKIPVVGVLWHAGSPEEEDVYLSVLVKALNDLGYVEGKNIHLDHRFPAENPDRFRTLAQELVTRRHNRGDKLRRGRTQEGQQYYSDCIGGGFVESLARLGGDVTGTSLMAIERSGSKSVACCAPLGRTGGEPR
jgi:hypothetical protein